MKVMLHTIEAVASTERWAVYPHWGFRWEFRYEEFQAETPEWRGIRSMRNERWVNHILVFSMEYGSGNSVQLHQSAWRWMDPFAAEEIAPEHRRIIIDRIRQAFEHRRLTVSSKELEVSAGLRKQSEPGYTVDYKDEGSLVYREGALTITVPFKVDGHDAVVMLSALQRWDPPHDDVLIGAETQAVIVSRLALAVEKRAKHLFLRKD